MVRRGDGAAAVSRAETAPAGAGNRARKQPGDYSGDWA